MGGRRTRVRAGDVREGRQCLCLPLLGVRNERQERGVIVCKQITIIIIVRIILLVVIVIVVVVIIIIIASDERSMFGDRHAAIFVFTYCISVHLKLSFYGSLRYSVTRAPRHAGKRERASE